jgi:hypothetical protein
MTDRLVPGVSRPKSNATILRATSQSGSKCASFHPSPLAVPPTQVSYARSLEFRLKVLEETLAAEHGRPAKRPRTSFSTHDTPRPSIVELSEYQKNPHAAAETTRRFERADNLRLGPPSASQALDRLPSAVDLAGLRVDNTEAPETFIDTEAVEFDIASFPSRSQAEIVLDHYFDYVHPPYPILHEPTFRAAIMALYQSSGAPSAQTVYAFYGASSSVPWSIAFTLTPVILAIYAINRERHSATPADLRREARGQLLPPLTAFDS